MTQPIWRPAATCSSGRDRARRRLQPGLVGPGDGARHLMYEWFGARTRTSRGGTGQPASPRARAGSCRGARGARLRAVAVAALRRGRAGNSRRRFVSTPTSSTRTTTSRDQLRGRRHRSARPSSFAGRRTFATRIFKPDPRGQSLRMLGRMTEAAERPVRGSAGPSACSCSIRSTAGRFHSARRPSLRRPGGVAPWSGRDARSSSIPTT